MQNSISIARWLFYGVVLPITPFFLALLLDKTLESANSTQANWMTIFTSAEILFLGIVLCASGLDDASELKRYESPNIWSNLISYALMLGIFASIALYSAYLVGRMRDLEMNQDKFLPFFLVLMSMCLSFIVYIKLLRAQNGSETQ